MEKYDAQKVEKKWQKFWRQNKTFQPDLKKAKRPFYNLMMFPYPSGEGLHVGNMYAFTGSDIYGRFKRMQGFDVFEPIGLDGFGIHSENYAIKLGRHPAKVSQETEKNFYRQLEATGNAYAWDNILETYDPDYYKWTQWVFVQMFKHGLAYRKKTPVNWCPSCKTVLADEQVVSGKCERCESLAEKRDLEQWFFKITDYAERLLKNLEWIDWSERVRVGQRNWIGRSEGTEITFPLAPEFLKMEDGTLDLESLNSRNLDQDVKTSRNQGQEPQENLPSRNLPTITVFTTRPDTIFGVTALVLAPEHPLIQSLIDPAQPLATLNQPLTSSREEVRKYVEASRRKSELERAELAKEKTGVFTGLYAENPINGERVPIWVGDYVVGWYGGGAVMLVPAHDQRDYEFAKKYDLPIRTVVSPDGPDLPSLPSETYEGEGTLVDSGEFGGLPSETARERITEWLEEEGLGRKTVSYKLRDWCVSRQRYWGPPIPMINCKKCGFVPVPEEDLPVVLPHLEDFQPEGLGKSPLAQLEDWVRVSCPKCGGSAQRETDVSDTFLDSAWYFFRYPSVSFEDRPFDKEATSKWLPVEMYIGGAEHTVLHLMYSRFVTMAFKDFGLIDFEEPYKRFYAHGLITKNGAKMSKSKGNVVIPDEYIEAYGADTLRMYLMFLGPFDQGGDFSDAGIEGIRRFLKKVWVLGQNLPKDPKPPKDSNEIGRNLHRLVKKVGEDIESLKFNTAIAAMMEFLNEVQKAQVIMQKQEWGIFLRLLAPFAPHIAEELWHRLEARGWKLEAGQEAGNSKLEKSSIQHPASFQVSSIQPPTSVHLQPWPKYNPKLLEEAEVTIIVQVDGKVRDRLKVKKDTARADVRNLAKQNPNVRRFLSGRRVKEMYFVPNRLINFATEAR